MIRYDLALPVSRSESKRRKLDQLTGRLVVQLEQEPDVKQVLANYTINSRIDGQQLVAQTITAYDTPQAIRSALSGATMRYWFDVDLVPSLGKPQNVVILCNSQEDVLLALRAVRTEAIVFYSVPINDGQPQLTQGIIGCSSDGYIEHNFLDAGGSVPLFAFLQSSHDSIEVLGKQEAVKAYFAKVAL